MNKNIVISAIVGILLVGGIFWAFESQNHTPAQPIGAITSPIIPSNFLQWGGMNRWTYKSNTLAASSTLCAFLSPAATTTLKTATLLITSSPAYSNTYEIGTGNYQGATTTAITYYTVASSAQADVIATTSVTALVDGVVAPSTWIDFNVSTSTVNGKNQATGDCEISLDQL